MFRGLILASLILLLWTSDAVAQSYSSAPTAPATGQEPGTTNRTRLMFGINVKQTLAPGEDAANRLGVGFSWRWRGRTARMDDRLAFAYRLGSYKTMLSGNVLGQNMDIGDAQLRPIMAGVDYKMPRGKWTWSVGLTTGLSINRLNTQGSFRDRVIDTTGNDVVTDIHNSWAWSPRFGGTYDLNRRLTFKVESLYNYSRPELTMRSGGTDMSRRLNADAFIVKAGFLYGVW